MSLYDNITTLELELRLEQLSKKADPIKADVLRKLDELEVIYRECSSLNKELAKRKNVTQ